MWENFITWLKYSGAIFTQYPPRFDHRQLSEFQPSSFHADFRSSFNRPIFRVIFKYFFWYWIYNIALCDLFLFFSFFDPIIIISNNNQFQYTSPFEMTKTLISWMLHISVWNLSTLDTNLQFDLFGCLMEPEVILHVFFPISWKQNPDQLYGWMYAFTCMTVLCMSLTWSVKAVLLIIIGSFVMVASWTKTLFCIYCYGQRLVTCFSFKRAFYILLQI